MPSPAPFTVFMEKKKRRSSTILANDLTVVKAAAWAWYQHGSGSEGKSIREFDVTNHHHHHNQAFRPSRYKLEAAKKIKEYSNNQESSSTSSQIPSPVHTEDNSLLDAYEVERISEQLDCLLVSSSNKFYTKLFQRDIDRQKISNTTTTTTTTTTSSSSSSNIGFSNSVIRKNKNFLKRLWMGHSITCGTREDVDPRALERIKPRPPQFPVP
ncbi:uncharacterized protein LOC126678051 [Mercurialis annua]|uniref:uncharacterized protein LOC126678051 n=1 Tax=Mercurialis annua TaxID=3986 RepID=UPI00215F0BDD|nr:uncharacterized protein LOC126678051 [Mercurialis annua]